MTRLIQAPAFKTLLWLLAVAVLFFAQLPTLWLAPHGDEAMYLLQSKLIADNGWLPYRDFFQFILPASLYFGAIVLKISGNSVLVLRLAVIGLQLSGLYALLAVADKKLKPSVRIFLIFFIWTGCISMSNGLSHHSLGGAIVPWILFFLLKEKPSVKPVAVLCSLLVLTSQVLGALISIATLACLWQQKLKLKPFFVFMLPLPALFVSHLILTNSLNEFVNAMQWLSDGHYAQTTTLGYFVNGLSAIRGSMLTWTPDRGWVILWTHLPLAVMVMLIGLLPIAGLIYGAKSLKRSDVVLNGLFFLALATVLSTFSYSSEYHISQVVWPAYLLGVLAIQPVSGNQGYSRKLLTTFLFLIIAGTLFNRIMFVPFTQDKSSWINSYGTREKQFWLPENPAKRQTLQNTIDILHAQPHPVFVWNASPELYLFSDRPPATRYAFTIPGLMSEKQTIEILSSLTTRPPALLVYDSLLERIARDDARYQHHGTLALPSLEKFVQGNYHILYSSDGYTVFVHNSKAEPVQK